MKTLFFSATGNNMYIAKRLGGEAVSIPQLVKNNDYYVADDKIGLVFPIYFLSVPKHIAAFLAKVELECGYLFAVMSCGNYPGAAVNQLANILTKRGYDLAYATTITMVDNWLPMFDIDKQLKGEPKKKIDARLDAIVRDVESGKQCVKRASVVARAATRLLAGQYPGDGMCKSYTVDAHCNGCGICVHVCPMDNITIADDQPLFGDTGISCLACTHNCPQNAIRAKGEKSKTRFRNQHVALAEIVKANK
ncbi:MAG: EFR1 family ferrodoxin [Syntrophomonadaceae bacterium]|jgi:ferredoxin|nr:EFR1 family ferrodoxin [Syntrophomonadaceae bacterium]